jgi:hypothetical protein
MIKDARTLTLAVPPLLLYSVYYRAFIFKIMNIDEMSLDEKKEALYDWIRNLDEAALDSLIEEYLNGE